MPAVVCADTDFGKILAREGAASPSVILFRGETQRQPGRQVLVLLANLDALAESLAAGRIAVIGDERLRVRDLPIAPS